MGLSLNTTHSGAPTGAPLSVRSLLLVSFAAFGGPVALAALYAPGAVEDVTSSAGLISIVASVAFLAPLALWLRYSRDIAGPGGLTAFVQAAAGRRVALAQAGVWVSSYLLYLLYTSAYVVYDLLPVAWPGVHRWRPLLVVLLPVAIAALLLAGRRIAIGAIALLGLGQVMVLGLLDAIAVHHAPTAGAFHGASSGNAALALGGIATLFVCGSLPLFLGGEVRGGGLAMRRVLPPAFAVAAVGVVLAVYPLAQDPAFAHADVPGVALAKVDAGHAAGVVVGVGVAASVVGVMLLEYVALTRVLHFVTGRSVRLWVRALAVPLVVAAPVSLLVGPERFYDKLLKPSLVLLWLAQIVVVAVFPLYLRRHGRLRPGHIALTTVALAVMGFGLGNTVFGASGT